MVADVMEFVMDDDNKGAKAEGRGEAPVPPRPRASIELPRPTQDQAEYLSNLQSDNRREYDHTIVVGGPRRRKA
jgi:hypothetical protein